MTPPGDLLGAISVSIVAAAALALVARRVRQPLILGYIAGGAFLGPHLGIGLVVDEASIEAIAEMGLILLLFIIGLELNAASLFRTGRAVIATGLLQVPLCAGLAWLALGGAAAWTGGDFDRLYLAVATALSSTLIVVKLLSDKLEMGTLTGRLTLGVLVIQDLWAIAFLAVQPNLASPRLAPLLGSLAAGAGLVAGAILLSRHVLPGLYRAIASSGELVLLVSMAWCFLVAGVAGSVGLSKEMGALIAGTVIAAFPYGSEVIGRLAGVRDFFVTLFFVALGLEMPAPSGTVLLLAVAVAAVVMAGRIAVILPLSTALRLDARTGAVVAVNLSQMSEFSLVIATLGAALRHVSGEMVTLIVYALILTSVVSTYAIGVSDRIAAGVAAALSRLGPARGFPRPVSRSAAGAEEPGRDLYLLGVSREGLALLQRLEREASPMKKRIVAIDFNPETLEQLEASGVACLYGDIANAETLRHAGIGGARIVVSPISDWFLKGTDNLRLLRQVRQLAPVARTIVTADTLAHAQALYAEGADYVLLPPALSAEHLHQLLRDGRPDALAAARHHQGLALGGGQSAVPDRAGA
ncbi:MAG TPA: cation:proton antiporter [Candidatus Methylomirabilis sp.]|nr:cation:proton antiporter [Candidatus Methylomirabilis sp.]